MEKTLINQPNDKHDTRDEEIKINDESSDDMNFDSLDEEDSTEE